MPVEWMLAVMRDPEAEQSRRDDMAKSAAPYLHPKLAAMEMHRSTGKTREINVVQIYAVPRGGSVDVKAGTITIDGKASKPTSLEPFEPTKPLELSEQTAAAEAREEAEGFQRSEPPAPLEVMEPVGDPTKLTSLDAWRRRKTDE
jgi:hypothetical protein